MPYSRLTMSKLIASEGFLPKLFAFILVQNLSLHRFLLIFIRLIMQSNYQAGRVVRYLFFVLYLTLIAVIPEAVAQVTVRGGTFILRGSNAVFSSQRLYVLEGATLTNEGSLYVTDTFGIRNDNSTFNNSGDFYADKAAVFDSADMNNTGTAHISSGLKVRDYALDEATFSSSTGNIVFFDTGDKILRTHRLGLVDLNELEMAATGASSTELRSSVHVNSLVLTNGLITYNNSDDSLLVNQGGVITGGNVNSYTDSLYRIPSTSGVDLYFPVGNTGSAGQFRPIDVLNINYVTLGDDPIIKVKYRESVAGSYDTFALEQLDNSNFWVVNDLVDSMLDYTARPSFRSGDIVTLADAIIAQSRNEPSKLFYPIGYENESISGDSVAAEAAFSSPNNSIIAIGQASKIKLDVNVFLGGAINGDNDSMETSLFVQILDTLVERFEEIGSSQYPMLPQFNIPNGAVDVVKVYLRNTPTGSNVDSARAWLMNDGTVRDFFSGTRSYLTFAHAPAGNYHVVVTHRNHLAVMSSATANLTTAIPGSPVDLTVIGNVYGAAAGSNSFVSYMWQGNTNGDREVNASDLSDVEAAYNIYLGDTNLDVGYLLQDVNFSDPSSVQVNVGDYNTVINGNIGIYFSAVPGI